MFLGTVKIKFEYFFELIYLIEIERDLLIFLMNLLLLMFDNFFLLCSLLFVVFHEFCNHLFELCDLIFHNIIEGK
jgi:hypothetical protein